MDNPWIYEVVQRFDPYTMSVWMNVQTGTAKGLKTGDLVWVESSTGGKIQGEVKLSECVHREVVAIGGCNGHRSVNLAPRATVGPHLNTLLSIDEQYSDPVTANIGGSAAVKVYKV
jgi:anaerobic selenocysteine-containing dehydrogenase